MTLVSARTAGAPSPPIGPMDTKRDDQDDAGLRPLRADGGPGWRSTLAVVLLLSVLVALVFRGTLDLGFYEDDYLWLTMARDVATTPSSFLEVHPANAEAVVRWTQKATMAMVHGAAGLEARPHHLVGLVLHVLVATLVFRWLFVLLLGWRTRPAEPPAPGGASPAERRTAGVLAATGAVLFATSHGHAMAVVWIAAQSGLWATAASLLTMLFLWSRRDRWGQPSTVVGGTLLFLLALLSKNTVVGLPVAVAALAALAPGVDRRSGLRLAGVLAGAAGVHLLVAKGLVPRISGAGLGENFGVSATTVSNLLGAMLAPFVSAVDHQALFGSAVPHELTSLVFVGAVLATARWLGVLRPVAWGLSWILALALPVCFLDYPQYDPDQLTVTRYAYAPMVGATVVVVHLLQGLLGRWRARSGGTTPASVPRSGARSGSSAVPRSVATSRVGDPVVALVLAALLTGHVVHHQGRVQERIDRLAAWGEADRTMIAQTVEQARRTLLRGTTVYAVGWASDDAFVRAIGELYFRPVGYDLAGEEGLERAVAAYRRGRAEEPWVALAERASGRLAIVPHGRYEAYRESGARTGGP